MDDLISRQEAINLLNKLRVDAMLKQKDVSLIWECEDAIMQCSTVPPDRKTGRWVFVKGDGKTCMDGWYCTACKRGHHTHVPYITYEFRFCPNCGAHMII